MGLLTLSLVLWETHNMREMTSEDARRNFRRLLNETEDGQHTEITRYNEGAAAVVPVEWVDDVIRIFSQLHQVEAGWDIYVPVELLREIARAAAAILPPALGGEMAGELEDETQQYVSALKTGSGSLRDHKSDCHCDLCRSLPGRIVPLPHDAPDQAP